MPIDDLTLERALDALGRAEGEGRAIHETLPHVIDAVSRVFGVTGAGLMLIDERDDLRYVAASDGTAQELERLQEEAGEGPCVLSFAAQAEVAVDDVVADGRWPELAPTLAAAGVHAVLGVPTRLGGAAVGSLNVYCASPHAWDLGERQAIAAFNGLVERSLAQAVAARQQGRVVEQLQYALDNRVVVERAIGMLMARHDVDAPAAFALLRNAARSSRRRVGDVAREILDGSDAADPPQPPA